MASVGVVVSQVLLVDDHPLFRAGLALVIEREPDLRVAAEASTADEAVEVAQRERIDIVVTDVMMPATNGIALVPRLLDVIPDCKLLGLSVLDHPLAIAAMLRSGASGYALKAQSPHEIIGAMRTVLE